MSQPGLEFSSQMLRDYAEPPSDFWVLLGSYFADFNLPNNFARCIIAKPSYGLVVIPSSLYSNGGPFWDFQSMAIGDTIGGAFLFSVNAWFNARYAWLNVIGDPTLRLNSVVPPTNVHAISDGANVDVTWDPGESGAIYYVYRSESIEGPFEVIGSPVSQAPWQKLDILDASTNSIYMVRASCLALTGRGSYWNLSQGNMAQMEMQ